MKFCFLGIHKWVTTSEFVVNVWGEINKYQRCSSCKKVRIETITSSFRSAEIDYKIAKKIRSLNPYELIK